MDAEKVKKRQERFGVVTPEAAKVTGAKATPPGVDPELLAKRAARFGDAAPVSKGGEVRDGGLSMEVEGSCARGTPLTHDQSTCMRSEADLVFSALALFAARARVVHPGILDILA